MANPNTAKLPAESSSSPVAEKPAPRATLTPIQNNMGPRGIPLPAVVQPADKEGEPPKTLEPADLLMLPIGVSYVPTEKWARAKKQKNIEIVLRARIRGTKAPEWQTVPVGQKILVELPPVDAMNPLGAMDDAEAIDFLEGIKDAHVLGALLDLEQRDRVILAIRDRKDGIEKKGIRAVEEASMKDRAVLEAD